MSSKENSKMLFASMIAGGVTALVISVLFADAQKTEAPIIEDTNEKIEQYNAATLQEDLVIEAVKKAQPAVVSIIITKDVPVIEQYYGNDPFGGLLGPSPFNFQIPQYRENGTEKREVGGGSGFIVSADGYIVTNNHVVSDTEAEYTVFLNDGTKYTAEVLDKDALNDIAIIKIDAKDLLYLQFGNSDELMAGQSVIAIGNPLLEFRNSISVGVISGLSRSIIAGNGAGVSEQLQGVIQTDAAINPGNSGGPLLNLKGEVIGVNVAVASAENIAFSIPANSVKQIFDSVKENGRIVRPFLGVRYIQVTESLKEKNSLSVDYGVLIIKGANAEELAVIPGSPADKAGLTENDIILEADGKKLDSEASLAHIVANKKVGDSLKLKVLSKGVEKEIEVKLEEVPE